MVFMGSQKKRGSPPVLAKLRNCCGERRPARREWSFLAEVAELVLLRQGKVLKIILKVGSLGMNTPRASSTPEPCFLEPCLSPLSASVLDP